MKSSILFVDDQQEVLDLLERIFAKEEYHLHFSTSAKGAIEILRNNEIDVIVTDMMMPDMSGLDLLKLAKKEFPDTVRIVLSGFAQVPIILEAVNSGDLYKYIAKPWKVNSKAKDIIKQAVEYSNLLKLRKLYPCSFTDITLSPDQMKEILTMLNKPFFLVNKNGEVCISSDNFSEIFDSHDLSLYKTIKAQNGYKIYIIE
jgi:DNA-binding NtrC family response regulator